MEPHIYGWLEMSHMMSTVMHKRSSKTLRVSDSPHVVSSKYLVFLLLLFIYLYLFIYVSIYNAFIYIFTLFYIRFIFLHFI